MPDIDPFEASRPSVSFKDAPVGASDGGEVLELPVLKQSRDYDTGNPAFWPDGNPKMAVVVPVRRADGTEAAFWAGRPSALFEAIRVAQINAGERIKVGGLLTVTYIGDKPNERNPRLNAAKQYRAVYKPPAAGDPFAGEPVLAPLEGAPAPAVHRPPAHIALQIASFVQAQMTNEQILAVPTVQSAGVSAAQIELIRAQGPV